MVLHTKKTFKVRVQKIIGLLKDWSSVERVRLHGDRRVAALQTAVIRATAHDERPPSRELVERVLQAETGSRLRISHCVLLLMQRLNKTKSWVVSLKCLALLHRSLQRGGFMYEDQVVLRFSPRNGAKNHLNLSQFRDDSSALAWQASSWIRWYAGYLETLIKASANPPIEVNALISTTDELMSKIVALDMLLNELGTCPSLADAASALASHTLIQDTFRLIVNDYANKRELLHYCLKEMSENRIPELSGPQITQLLHACKTLSSTGASYGRLNELALSFKVAVPLPLIDHVTSTEQELLNMSEVYTAAALRSSDAALQGKSGALIKYVASSDPLTPPKLPGPAIFRHSKVVSSQ